MVTSCAVALQSCVQATEVAQAALTQCSQEHHIFHAIAVFAELGIGISSASIVDPLDWRAAYKQIDEPTAIKRANFLVEAKLRGRFSYAVNCILETRFLDTLIIRFLILYVLPIIGLLLATYVLCALSFHEFIDHYLIALSEPWLFWCAFISFALSLLSAYFQRKEHDTAKGVKHSLTLEI